MNPSKAPLRFCSAVTLAAVAFFTAPAFAQRGGGHGGGHGSGGGHAASHGSAPHVAGVARSAGHGTVSTARPYGYAVARPGIAHGGVAYRPYGYHGYYPYYRPYYSYYRPYYTFRPYVSLGFGFYAGYPVGYPYYSYPAYAYPYPYPYSYPTYAYPQAAPYQDPNAYQSVPPEYPPQPQGSLGVTPGQTNEGGLSFEVTPGDAQLFIDGSFVGTVGSFSPTSRPLTLSAGRHHVEIRAPGYRSMTFDADVVAGQVLPYQGTLMRQ